MTSFARYFISNGGTFCQDLTIGDDFNLEKYNLDNGPVILGLTLLPYPGTATIPLVVNRFLGRRVNNIIELEVWGILIPGAGDFECGFTIDFSGFSGTDFYQPTFNLSTPIGHAVLEIANNNNLFNGSDSAVVLSNSLNPKVADVVFRRPLAPAPLAPNDLAFFAVQSNWYLKITSF